MNSQGEILYIGVDDNGSVVGLEEDYKTLEKPNSDQLRLIIKNSLQGYLKDKVIFEHIKLDFPLTNGKEICRIRVSASHIPVFVHESGKQECYVRVDNESKPYSYDEFIDYWQRHITKK